MIQPWSPARLAGPGSRVGVRLVVVAAALDLDRLEVGIQVNLHPGAIALDELDVVGGPLGPARTLDLTHGSARNSGHGCRLCPLGRSATDVVVLPAVVLVAASRAPAAAVVAEVAGTVLAGSVALVDSQLVGAMPAVVGADRLGGGHPGGRVVAGHRAGDTDAADEKHQPCCGTNDPLAAQSHRLLPPVPFSALRGDSRRRRRLSGSRCHDATETVIC